MAFRQSTHPPPQRQLSVTLAPEPLSTTLSEAEQQRDFEASQEWVLFSPSLAPSTARTQTTSTDRTTRTAGLSRVSDFGSFNTIARSGDLDEDETAGSVADEDVDDDEELDSLDDGLHAFHEPSPYRTASRRLDQSGGSVLPTHDGLGTFPASSLPVQEQLWQFEQFNPRRKTEGQHRRRPSLQKSLDVVQDGQEAQVEQDRLHRIEKWRMEQSRVVLEEIEKETRQRRLSRSVVAGVNKGGKEVGFTPSTGEQRLDENLATPDPSRTLTEEPEETETFWQRITRRVIRDLIGIDDSILSVIFGESLPSENAASVPHQPASLLSQGSDRPIPAVAPLLGKSWEDRLFERVARELDVLVHKLSEHPGAFSTYLKTSDPSNDYAGIPITRSSTPRPPAQNSAPYDSGNIDLVDAPLFSPTLQDANTSANTHAALWGIEEEPVTSEEARLKLERDYWEREVDVRTVFRFLRNRFTNSYRSSPGAESSTGNSLAMSSTHDTARRAAIIRQHHPLVSRTHDRERLARRTSLLHHHHSYHVHHSSTSPLGQLKRAGSSCASSTKKSLKRGSGSSRNYWDIGGSVGSGSAIAATGVMGSWGEV